MNSTRIDCFFGDSGAGKSRSILELILKVYKATGKIARVYVGDGSGATYLDSGLVDAGVIKLMDYSAREYPLTVTEQMADGWWPKGDPMDPDSPIVELTREERSKTGMWVFEGISVMGLYIMGHRLGGLAHQAGAGVRIGGEPGVMLQDAEYDAKLGRYKEGTGTGRKYGGNTLGSYGVAQTHVLDRIERSKGLPGWVIWTGHEVVSEDKVTNEKVVGPEMAGKAKSAQLSRTFNATLHFTTVLKNRAQPKKVADAVSGVQVKTAELEYRIYTRDHYDPEGLTQARYRSVIRTPLPEMVKDYYTGKPGEAILALYGDMDKAMKAYAAQLGPVNQEKSA